MSRRFWRNVTLIALAHVALALALLRWASASKTEQPAAITWLSSADLAETEGAAEQMPEQTPVPTPTSTATNIKSEIELAAPTSTPRAVVKPSVEPTPKNRVTPKPKPAKPKLAASRSPVTKKTGKSLAKANEKPPKGNVSKQTNLVPKANSGTGDTPASSTSSGNGSAASAWYADMLHDRFYKAWEQPMTVVASGAKFSARVKIRIEKDGHVSEFKIVQPSGNVVVDESVQAVAKRVTNVDAPPANVVSSGHYDVNVNFALNAE